MSGRLSAPGKRPWSAFSTCVHRQHLLKDVLVWMHEHCCTYVRHRAMGPSWAQRMSPQGTYLYTEVCAPLQASMLSLCALTSIAV